MPLNKKKTIALATTIVFLITLDRFFKSLSLAGYLNKPVKIIGNIISLQFSKNYYIAFSIPVSGLLLNIVITLIIIGLIIYLIYLFKKKLDFNIFILISLIVLGAISNLFDRIKFGYVVDYIDLKYFTVFNIADVMIVGGVLGLFYYSIRLEKRNIDITNT